MSLKVVLTYFKPTGKYYTGGEYVSDKTYLHEVFDEVRAMTDERRLPGLVENHSPFYVTIDVPEHPHNGPALFIPPQLAAPSSLEPGTIPFPSIDIMSSIREEELITLLSLNDGEVAVDSLDVRQLFNEISRLRRVIHMFAGRRS